MGGQQIREVGHKRLGKLEPKTEAIDSCKAYLTDYQARTTRADDAYVWLTCALALEAANAGNFGVGAVLIDDAGQLVAQGHNEVFDPYFRSDRHAEMVVMDEFEDAHPDLIKLDGYTLYTSLEPCPMCLVRLSTCSVPKVLFAARDMEGGMVHRSDKLPPFWSELVGLKMFDQADCSRDLATLANQIFVLNLAELTAKIIAR